VDFGARAQGLEPIDAVLHNAGIMTSIYRPAEDNEMTITVTVSTFLLSLLLLPKLRESAKTFNIVPRNTIVGSEVHNWVSFKERFSAQGEILADMNDQSKARMKDRYFASKLIVMFCVRELADLISTKNKNDSGRGDVIVNCPAPGFVATELEQDNPEALSYLVMEKVLARTPEVGSRCLVDGLVRGMESHGAYLSECVVKE
jgi:retinol dehydrogenase-12